MGFYGPSSGGTVPTFHPGYVSGNYYSIDTVNINAASLAADTFYAHPLLLFSTVSLAGIACQVSTGAASTHARMGLYTSSAGGPGTLVAEVTTPADTSSTGTKYQTFGSGQSVAAGCYWLAMLLDGTPTTHVITNASPYGKRLLGSATASHINWQDTVPIGVTASRAYGALPSTFPSWTEYSGSVLPYMFVKVT